jgi:hypothetical protein
LKNPQQETAIEPGAPWEVDLMQPEDAQGVARLFQTVYGQGYPIKTYLEPEQLKTENAAGRIISSVARTPRGHIVGHNALYRSAPYQGIFEAGAGLVHPDYRGGNGIFTRLVSHGQEVAAGKFGVEALFGEAVCNHIFSQKLAVLLDWTTHAVEVDLMPASAYVQEKSATGRVASLLSFKTLVAKPHKVHIPGALEAPLQFIYQGLDDRREFVSSTGTPALDAKTTLGIEIFDFAQVARITVHETGLDLKSVMDHHEKNLVDKGVQVIQVWLDMAWPWIGWVVDVLRANGFFLGGVLPRWFDTDGLLLQKILKQPYWEGIKIHLDRNQKLLAMVRQDWQATGGDK